MMFQLTLMSLSNVQCQVLLFWFAQNGYSPLNRYVVLILLQYSLVFISIVTKWIEWMSHLLNRGFFDAKQKYNEYQGIIL